MTALSGGNISEESFAMSTAILAAPYAAFHADSLDELGSLGVLLVGLEDGEATDSAMPLDKATSVLQSLVRGWNLASSCSMRSAMGGGSFVGVDDNGPFFRR